VTAITLVLDGGLRSLLPPMRRGDQLDIRFHGPQSIKHLLESEGIPHTEIGEITTGHLNVGLAYLPQNGDLLQVRSVLAAPTAEAEPAFALDGHLGRLAARLRGLGIDTAYAPNAADDALANACMEQGRIILTRDRRLLMRNVVTRGCLIRSLSTNDQLDQVMKRYQLQRWARPFIRCIRCNTILSPVSKRDVLDRLLPLTRLYYQDFRLCPGCGRVYWNGSHVKHIRDALAPYLEAGQMIPFRGESPGYNAAASRNI
jgi:uncharacterized protein with PIN domain